MFRSWNQKSHGSFASIPYECRKIGSSSIFSIKVFFISDRTGRFHDKLTPSLRTDRLRKLIEISRIMQDSELDVWGLFLHEIHQKKCDVFIVI